MYTKLGVSHPSLGIHPNSVREKALPEINLQHRKKKGISKQSMEVLRTVLENMKRC